MSSDSSFLSFRLSGTSPLRMRSARPSTIAVLPTPGSPISTGIVLGAAGQHLDGAADFLVAADHGVELAVARGLRQVAGIFLQRVIGVFGRRAIGGAALAQGLDRRVEVLRRDAALAENAAGLAALLKRQPKQQPLDRDKAVAGLLGGLFPPHRRRAPVGRKIDLPGAASRDFRQLLERVLGAP